MLYVDTSAFISLYVREGRSAAIVTALAARRDGIAISPWVLTEAASAIALKLRTQALSLSQASAIRQKIDEDMPNRYLCEVVREDDFNRAAMFISNVRSALRAGDALHLAICARIGADVITLDQHMRAAAIEIGLGTVDIE